MVSGSGDGEFRYLGSDIREISLRVLRVDGPVGGVALGSQQFSICCRVRLAGMYLFEFTPHPQRQIISSSSHPRSRISSQRLLRKGRALRSGLPIYRLMKMCAERGILFGGMLQGGGFGGDGDRIRDIEGRGLLVLELGTLFCGRTGGLD